MPDPAAAGGVRRRLWIHCLGSPVPAVDRCAERALVLAGADDIVWVPRAVDPEYLGYLASLGLGPTAANVVVAPEVTDGLAPRLARRMGTAEFALDAYTGTPQVFALASALEATLGRRVPVHAAPPEITAAAGSRDLARAQAVDLGIPVAHGEVASLPSEGRRRRDLEPLRAAIERQLRRTGRVLVRSATAGPDAPRHVVGTGAEDVDDVLRQVARSPQHRTYLVEVLVDAAVCSTVHLVVEPGSGGIRRLGISDRRMGRGTTAVGCRYPTGARMAAGLEVWAVAIAGRLRDVGYMGHLGIDFAESRDPESGGLEARFTGLVTRACEGVYALGMAETLRAPAFVSGMVATRLPTFGRLREALGGLLYDPDRGAGVVPYATGSLEHGRCPVVALGPDRFRASELLGEAQAALEQAEPAAARRG